MDEGGFLNLLELCFNSTSVEFEGPRYTQKEGVCIGSPLAPALSEIYLAPLDLKALVQSLLDQVVIIERFVDDILISSVVIQVLPMIKKGIIDAAPELSFSHEEPIDGEQQFLDLRLNLSDGLCWEFGQLAPKPLLLYQSCQSKLVKRGVVMSLLDNALKKSCVNRVDAATKNQQ